MEQQWKWVLTLLACSFAGDALGIISAIILGSLLGLGVGYSTLLGILVIAAFGFGATAAGLHVADWVMTRVECREEVSRREGNQG